MYSILGHKITPVKSLCALIYYRIASFYMLMLINITCNRLSLMSALFSKYPNILKEQDFMPLLRVIADLQSTCKDSFVMGYLCQ